MLDSPKPPAERVTFTQATLMVSRAVCFVATGAAKVPVLREILARGDDGALAYASPAPAYPAAQVRAADGKATWFLDSAAGAGL